MQRFGRVEVARHTVSWKQVLSSQSPLLNLQMEVGRCGTFWNSTVFISFSVFFLLSIASAFLILTRCSTLPPSAHCKPNTVTLSLGSTILHKRYWIYSCIFIIKPTNWNLRLSISVLPFLVLHCGKYDLVYFPKRAEPVLLTKQFFITNHSSKSSVCSHLSNPLQPNFLKCIYY